VVVGIIGIVVALRWLPGRVRSVAPVQPEVAAADEYPTSDRVLVQA